jgi:hypothetical protein
LAPLLLTLRFGHARSRALARVLAPTPPQQSAHDNEDQDDKHKHFHDSPLGEQADRPY